MGSARAQARSAEVLLARDVIGEEEVRDLLGEICGVGLGGRDGTAKMTRLGTGVRSLDEALDGGLSGGRISGIWGGVGVGASEVSFL